MDMALYHPTEGYYRRKGAARIGVGGDFLTSVSVSALFGRILAGQIDVIRRDLGAPPDFAVVEYGAHRGQLRADILAELPDLTYHAVEAGDSAPESITGCVLANEFLDALPVHRVRVTGGAWQEIYVEVRETKGAPPEFKESLGPLSDARLTAALADLPAHLMEGYTTEVNLRAHDWLEDVSRRLARGRVLIIDYGYERHDFFAPHRHTGTLTCYHRHRRSAHPFANIGEQDITSHVEFTSLMQRADSLGLRVESFTEQGRYLLEAGAGQLRAIVERDAGRLSRDRAALQQLMHPDFMGRAFHVLVLRRD